MLFAMHCKISPQIFAFISESNGSNCFLLKGKKHLALIDSSTPDNRLAIIEWLSSLDLKPTGITLILHTHCHADHFGNDKEFPNAKIAMHPNDASAINRQDNDVTCAHLFLGVHFPKVSESFSAKKSIDLGGIKLRVLETPGHTSGGVCFFLEKEKILFSGDTLFAGSIGRTDLPGGDPELLQESLLLLSRLKIKLLLPGHGQLLKGEKENRRNINAALKML